MNLLPIIRVLGPVINQAINDRIHDMHEEEAEEKLPEIAKFPKVNVGSFVFDTNQDRPKILLGKKDGLWSIPVTRLKWGEPLQACAMRSIWDSCGVVIGKIQKLNFVEDLSFSAEKQKHTINLLYTSAPVGGKLYKKDETYEEWKLFDIEDRANLPFGEMGIVCKNILGNPEIVKGVIEEFNRLKRIEHFEKITYPHRYRDVKLI